MTTSSGASVPSSLATMLFESIVRRVLLIWVCAERPSETGSNARSAAACFCSSKSRPAISKIASTVERCIHPSTLTRPMFLSGLTRMNASLKGLLPMTSQG